MASRVRTILGTMTFGAGTNAQVAQQMLDHFAALGHSELDTAIMYVNGETERLIGSLSGTERFAIASKANSRFDVASNQTTIAPHASLGFDKLRHQFDQSAAALRTQQLDLFYLHWPDYDTPIEDSLRAINSLHVEGKIKRFGMSNYSAWQVVEAYYICKANGWLLPTVYQGMYNAITRQVEKELFPALRRLGIQFYAYNPLCGGLLTGRYNETDEPTTGRFAGDSFWAAAYRARYMNPEQFAALKLISKACTDADITISDAAIRWLYFHSALSAERHDGVILGASSFAHLEHNLAAVEQGELPQEVVAAMDQAWHACQSVCPQYFR